MQLRSVPTTGDISTLHDRYHSTVSSYQDQFIENVVQQQLTAYARCRLPEHCIEYVKVIQWEKENPFGASLDGDDPQHLSWVYEKAQDRANQFHITGLSYRLVQGVLKNIIPAVASTNAVIASVCATEVSLSLPIHRFICAWTFPVFEGLQNSHQLLRISEQLHGVQRCWWYLHVQFWIGTKNRLSGLLECTATSTDWRSANNDIGEFDLVFVRQCRISNEKSG